MDWSPPSRRSASRREQNLALLGAVVSGAVIAFGVLLLLIGRVNPQAGAALRGAATDVVMPLWSVVRAPLEAVKGAAEGIGNYFGAVSRNRLLTAELAAGRARLQRADAQALANAQLKRLLRVVEPRVRLVATARIAGASSGGIVRSAVISAGARDGVRPGQPVRADAGLVGRTLETGASATRVLLLTDPGSRVPVIVERTGQPALLVGANAPLLEIRDRVGAEVPLHVGDRLLTSGDGGVFAPGIPAAVVVRAAEPPLARPAATPDGLGYVAVETPFLPVPAVTRDRSRRARAARGRRGQAKEDRARPAGHSLATAAMTADYRLRSPAERLRWLTAAWRRLVPPASVLGLLLIMTAPVVLPWPALPQLGLAAVFVWATFQPGLMPPWLAFVLGLAADLLFGLPLGVEGLAFALTALFVRLFERRFGHHRFGFDWSIFAAVAGAHALLGWQFMALAGVAGPLNPQFIQAAATVAAYPFVVLLCAGLQRRWLRVP